jgi:hypothetical protein
MLPWLDHRTSNGLAGNSPVSGLDIVCLPLTVVISACRGHWTGSDGPCVFTEHCSPSRGRIAGMAASLALKLSHFGSHCMSNHTGSSVFDAQHNAHGTSPVALPFCISVSAFSSLCTQGLFVTVTNHVGAPSPQWLWSLGKMTTGVTALAAAERLSCTPRPNHMPTSHAHLPVLDRRILCASGHDGNHAEHLIDKAITTPRGGHSHTHGNPVLAPHARLQSTVQPRILLSNERPRRLP